MITALLLLLASPAAGDAPAAQCPLIQLYSAAPKQGTLSFLALPSVEGATYNWTISAGAIVSGQGTTEIWVEAEVGSIVTATVEIGGLPANCDVAYSSTDEILASE